VLVEIRDLGLRAGHVRHAHDWAVGWTRVQGKPRGLEVVRSDVGSEKKSRGSLKGGGIVTHSDRGVTVPRV
jgi:hypothetical protein